MTRGHVRNKGTYIIRARRVWGQEEQNQLREHQGKRNIGSKGHSGQNVKTGS